MNLMEMMKKAQSIQSDMQSLNDELTKRFFSGESGGGLVRVILRGDGTVQGVEIDPSLLSTDEQEVVQDLVATAFNHAGRERRNYRAEKMQGLSAGLPIPPGLFGNLE